MRGRIKLKRQATDVQEILQYTWLVRWWSEHQRPYKELRWRQTTEKKKTPGKGDEQTFHRKWKNKGQWHFLNSELNGNQEDKNSGNLIWNHTLRIVQSVNSRAVRTGEWGYPQRREIHKSFCKRVTQKSSSKLPPGGLWPRANGKSQQECQCSAAFSDKIFFELI